MYLHLGNDITVRQREVLGIFDLDITSQSYRTREFLAKAEQNGTIVNAAGALLPKSFVLCAGRRVYLSALNPQTLLRRSESELTEEDMAHG